MKLALIANLTVKEPSTLDNPVMHLIPHTMCKHIAFEDIKKDIKDQKLVNLSNRLKAI